MATDAIIVLERLRCNHESDVAGGSEPYIWPALLWIDDNTLATPALVGVTAPALGNARVVIKNDMRAGQTADIPSSVGVLRVRFEDGLSIRRLILAVALWEEDETPEAAMRAGFQAFSSELRAAVADNLFALSQASEQELDAIIETVKSRVKDRVKSAIENGLTGWQKARVFLGTLNLDDIIGSDFKNFPDLLPTPTTLTFPFETGQLLSYGDAGTPGNVSAPVVVGFGGWLDFKFLFAGRNAAGEDRIYAVDQNGQLLSYGDAGTPGNVSNPVVVGFGGWLDFKFLFADRNAAGEDRIYAVDQNGQLLSYGDAGTPGNVSAPVVVGFGGWLDFKFLFAGRNAAGEDRIYAVDQNGQLLSYGDAGTPGNVSNPVVVGFGGWLDFKFLFAGRNAAGEDRIYAVDQNGQLLSYGDAGTPGNVSNPVVVGFGGWLDFKFLFAGRNAAGADRIYAVRAGTSDEHYEIEGNLRVQPVLVERCQAEVNAVKAAQSAVDGVDAEIRALQAELQQASPAEKPFIISEIKRLREEELPIVIGALEGARRALQACREATD